MKAVNRSKKKESEATCMYGLLTDQHFTFSRLVGYGAKEVSRVPIGITSLQHIGDVIELAYTHKLSQVWVHLSQDGYEALPDSFMETPAHYDVRQGKHKATFEYPHSIGKNLSWSGDRPLIGVGFLQHEKSDWLPDAAVTNQAHKFSGIPAKDVYLMFDYLERLLDMPMHHSTGRIGQELIKRTNQGNREAYLEPCAQDVDDFRTAIDPLSSWHRRLTADEQAQQWLIAIDKNADYLAASGLQLGYGEYEHIKRPAFNVQVPGLWLVSVVGSSEFDGNSLPLAARVVEAGRGWLYSPMVKLLQDLGYQVTIHEAKVWPKQHISILGQWQKILSNAYTTLRSDTDSYQHTPSKELAKEAVRGMYIKALSWFSMDKVFEDSSVLYRPAWYGSVISEARQRIIRNIVDHRLAGLSPVIVVRDGLWYVANSPDIQSSLPGLRIEKKPGHYKQAYALPLASCKHLFDSELPTSTLLAELKKLRSNIYA